MYSHTVHYNVVMLKFTCSVSTFYIRAYYLLSQHKNNYWLIGNGQNFIIGASLIFILRHVVICAKGLGLKHT